VPDILTALCKPPESIGRVLDAAPCTIVFELPEAVVDLLDFAAVAGVADVVDAVSLAFACRGEGGEHGYGQGEDGGEFHFGLLRATWGVDIK